MKTTGQYLCRPLKWWIYVKINFSHIFHQIFIKIGTEAHFLHTKQNGTIGFHIRAHYFMPNNIVTAEFVEKDSLSVYHIQNIILFHIIIHLLWFCRTYKNITVWHYQYMGYNKDDVRP